MCRDFDDPWGQTTEELDASGKELGIGLLLRSGVKRVVELGRSLGAYSARLAGVGMTVRGTNVSTSAIGRARSRYPGIDFVAADALDFEIYRAFDPDAVVMAEITWYILDKLDEPLERLRDELPGKHLLHFPRTSVARDRAFVRGCGA